MLFFIYTGSINREELKMDKNGYTHVVTFYKKERHLGWVFCDFRTTQDDLKIHLKNLTKKQAAGTVRTISFNRISA